MRGYFFRLVFNRNTVLWLAFASALALVLAIGFACVTVVGNNDSSSEPFRFYPNQVYVEGEAHERQVLDIYVPTSDDDDEVFPVLLWIHGGSWRIGNKYGIPEGLRDFLLENRVAMVSMNYRYVSQAAAPSQIHDTKTAVRFLRAKADRYNLDPTRIVASGFSAGGFLASYLGLTDDPDFEAYELGYENYSSSVVAIANMAAPYNFDSNSEWRNVYDVVGISWEQTFWLFSECDEFAECPEEVRRYSPINYTSVESVPFYIQHGSLDLLIPVSQAHSMCDALRQVGTTCDLDIVIDGFHNALVTERYKEFVLKNLGIIQPDIVNP